MATTAIPGCPSKAAHRRCIFRQLPGPPAVILHSPTTSPRAGSGSFVANTAVRVGPCAGPFPSHAAFIDPDGVAARLADIGFSVTDVGRVAELLVELVQVGPSGSAGVLVHGEFDTSHIFGRDGEYTGLIDFGEIRGADYSFDFATLMVNMYEPDRGGRVSGGSRRLRRGAFTTGRLRAPTLSGVRAQHRPPVGALDRAGWSGCAGAAVRPHHPAAPEGAVGCRYGAGYIAFISLNILDARRPILDMLTVGPR